jgi:photosystem II stability/assembly factor-like uncharacterized protein
MKRILCLLLLAFIALNLYAEDPHWVREGPNIGTIISIVPDRAHPQIWFAIDAPDRRLFRSIDNGKTWQYANQKGITQVLVHSVSSEVFIVHPKSSHENELLSSVDQGQTFKLRTLKSPLKVFDHPSDAKILWGSGFDYYGYDLTISYDRGEHWALFFNLPYKLGKEYVVNGVKVEAAYYDLLDLLVSPFNPTTVYISLDVIFRDGHHGDDYYTHVDLITNNSGKSWKSEEGKVYKYFYDPAYPDRAFSISYPEQLNILTRQGWKLVSQKNPFGNIVSVPGRPNELIGITDHRQYISHDGGINWSRTSIGPGAGARVVAARTFPEGSLLAGTSGAGLYEIDANRSFNTLSIPFKQQFIYRVATAPNTPFIYVIAGEYDHFLYRSLNSGKSWENITDTLPLYVSAAAGPYDLFVDPNNARHVFVGVKDKLAVSFDAGRTWSYVPQTPLRKVFFDPDRQTTYFAKPAHGHLFISNDGGRTLKELPAQFGDKHNTISDFSVNASNGHWYIATKHGLFVSKDQGQSARQIAIDLFDCFSCVDFFQVISLPKPGYLLVVTENGIYKSTNEGKTWQKQTKRTGKLFAVDQKGQHLFRVNQVLSESTDGGITWNDISSEINHTPSFFYTTALTDPRYRPLYLSTSVGLFSTTN